MNLDGLTTTESSICCSDDGLREEAAGALDFDVSQYKERITDYLEAAGRGREVSFARMVRNRTAAEIARLFLATVHLASDGNMEIKNPLMDGFNILLRLD